MGIQPDCSRIYRRWHLSILDTCSSGQLTVILITIWWLQKLGKERLAVSKQAAQKFYVERFNLRKPNELEVRKPYQIEISNRFAALENLSEIVRT